MLVRVEQFVLPILLCSARAGGVDVDDNWDHREILDPEGTYTLFWTVTGDTVVFRTEVATTGWVGFGLSPRGTLVDSDVVIGWVEGWRGHLYDLHGNRYGQLATDKHQSWKLLVAYTNWTHTVLQFSRKLDTCDFQDMPIRNGTHPTLYAYSSNIPSYLNNPSDMVSELRGQWRSHYLKLLAPRRIMAPAPEVVFTWDVRAENVHIPGNVTAFYYCKIVRVPPLEREHHIIEVSPINPIPGVAEFLTTSYCVPKNREEAEAAVKFGGFDCLSENALEIWTRCWNFISYWNIGNKPMIYPQHVGQPLGGGKNMQYALFLAGYWNPSKIQGLVYNSGLRHYYTPHLRPYSGTLLFTGGAVSVLDVIPPGMKKFTLAAHSSPECLSEAIPKSGIKIFAVQFYAQSTARTVRLRHFRGNKELPPIAEDFHIDVYHSEPEYLHEDVTFLPGDQMTMECTYDTTGRNSTTVGGLQMDEEICNVLVSYYPIIAIGRSLSSTTPQTVAKMLDLDLVYESLSINDVADGMIEANSSFVHYVKNHQWKQSTVCAIQDVFQYFPKYSYCTTWSETHIEVPYVSYPDNLIPFKRTRQCEHDKHYAFIQKYNEEQSCI